MRYDFECEKCSLVFEHSCSMSERPESLPCQCGGEARQIIIAVPYSCVRFAPYEFDKSKNVRSNGALFGRTDEQQHEHYRRSFDMQRKLVAQERRKPGKDDGFEYLGGMPGEMVDSIEEKEGKEAVAKDPVTFLKQTGMYMGR